MNKLTILLASALFVCGVNATNPISSPMTTSGNIGYVSAQLPIDPSTGQIIQGDIGTLTTLALSNMESVLKSKGFTMAQVLKTEVYLTDIRDYDAMIAAYATVFNYQYPPAIDVFATDNLPLRSRIQISCIADKTRVQ